MVGVIFVKVLLTAEICYSKVVNHLGAKARQLGSESWLLHLLYLCSLGKMA